MQTFFFQPIGRQTVAMTEHGRAGEAIVQEDDS